MGLQKKKKTGPINEFITTGQFSCKCAPCGCGTCDYESCRSLRDRRENKRMVKGQRLMQIIWWRFFNFNVCICEENQSKSIKIKVNKYNWWPESSIIWWVSGSLLSPLGVLAWPLVAVEFWLGVVSTFFWRAFFLLDTGVRGGGSANRSTSLLCGAATFSLFSVVLSLSLLSWQCCGVIRPLSEVRLEAYFLSTDGDTSFFREENAGACDS